MNYDLEQVRLTKLLIEHNKERLEDLTDLVSIFDPKEDRTIFQMIEEDRKRIQEDSIELIKNYKHIEKFILQRLSPMSSCILHRHYFKGQDLKELGQVLGKFNSIYVLHEKALKEYYKLAADE